LRRQKTGDAEDDMAGENRSSGELSVLRRIEQDSKSSRRTFIGGAAAATAAAAVLMRGTSASAGTNNYAAAPPPGFSPFTSPGTVVKVGKAGSLMPNGQYPKEDDAKEMLRRALQELTGQADMAQAAALFVHKDDKVCVKVNGIATEKMGTNKELVLPFVEAMIVSGVPPENITVLEQYGSFLAGTRVSAQNVPKGVKVSIHQNQDATMDFRVIPGTGGTQTKFVRALTESTALINFSLIKDHSICGYTGCLKNMTHGCSINPEAFHGHHASPQIALMAAQDVIKSRMRLHITDGFKVMAHGGPLWKYAQYVVPHEAVYVTTDPVAMDAIGWEIVDKARADFKLKSLADDKRIPAYIQDASDLGLGIADRASIVLKDVTI
jgi:uncharacterized protein (DUF362 family)